MKQVLGRRGLWVGWFWLAAACVGCTGSEGDPCQLDSDCDKGLVCDPPNSARGTCKNPADIQTESDDAGLGTGGIATGGSSSGSGGSDAATDASTDASVDAAIDAGEDASIDAAVDASIDASVDAGGDASAGGA
jgi:hypothetical protein